jgi:hypothetical protein
MPGFLELIFPQGVPHFLQYVIARVYQRVHELLREEGAMALELAQAFAARRADRYVIIFFKP